MTQSQLTTMEQPTTALFIDHLSTPIGRLALLADDADRLHAVGFTEDHERMQETLGGQSIRATPRRNPGGLTAALAAYFDGDLAAIDELPVALAGTPFQRAVWQALRAIPCGATWSYGQLARHIGNPAAVRAVGRANGANPIGIVLPCHRVIGAAGALTGYGGGLPRKRWLLAHEAAADQQLSLLRA